jgi:PAS domain S-box-containing protein
MIIHSISDDSRSREQLVQELEALRGQLTIENQRNRELSAELIRERKKAQQVFQQSHMELSSSKARYDWILEQVGIGTWFNELPFGRLTWDSQTKRLFFTPADTEPTIGLFWSRIHPDDRERTRLAVERAIHERTLYAIDHRAVNPETGEVRWIRSTGRATYGRDGTPQCFDGINYDISGRKRAEDELIYKSELLQRIFDNIPVLLVMWDPRPKRFTLNRHAETVLGWTSTDANTGDFLNKVFPDTAGPAEATAYMRSLMHGWRELSVTTKDGGSVPSSWSNMFLADETMICIGVDLRERNRALQALQESENNFRVALKNSTFVPSRFDRELRYQWIYNSHPDFETVSVVGKRDDELDDTESAKRLVMLKGQVIESGIGVREKIGFKRSDGIRSYDFMIEPLFDLAGIVVGGTSIAFDITERELAEDAVRESEERLRFALENSHIGAWELDLVNQAIHRSLEHDRIFGYTEPLPEWTYRMFLEQVLPEDRAAVDAKFHEAMAIPGHWSLECRIRRADGEVRWLWVAGRLRLDAAGGALQLTGVLKDITERKQAEEGLHRFNETLEQQVAERTVLASSRARQLQALAVELIEAEERERQRIAGLLHEDLQQLLAGARFTLQSTRHPDPALEEVQRILEESIRKARQLSHELSPAVLHQSGLTAALEWLCAHKREKFGLTVELDNQTVKQVESAPLKAFAFRTVKELLFNIVKHAGVNSARVTLAGSESEFVITVSDFGKGFDVSTMEAHSPKAGLGLLSLRERASYIGGSLSIESTLGQGSRITLSIPTTIDRAADPIPAAEDEGRIFMTEEIVKMVDKQSIRLLFVDDHKVMRQGLIRLISGQPDIEVVGEAANGREALELARQFRPDTILMDISMPGMDGIDATRRIKAEMPQVRVIGLSMFEDEQSARQMRDAGADGFVIKTASAAELLKAIYGIDDSRQQ